VPEVEHRLGLLHLRRGEWELADASLARAAEGLDPATRALVLADRSLAAHRLGRDDDAERLASGALRLAADVDDGRALAQARNVTGMLAAARGDLVTAVTELERAVELAQAAGDPGQQAAALNNLALAVGRSGDVGRATTLLEEALATCRRTGDRHRVAAIRNNLADALRAAGRDDEAMAELKEAVALFAEVGEVGRLEPEIWKLSEW
jgi:tetratricopeptide (TPR) repeat protein